MPATRVESPVVFLLDVDNTLLDNDRLIADLERHLERELGASCRRQYFEIVEALRAELGYVDYLGALQRYRLAHPLDPRLLAVSSFLLDYPFAERVFPGAREVLGHLAESGPTVLLSDGDAVFQPRKIERSGLGASVEGRVLVYVHKEQELADVERRFPARHYVLVDDKPRILAAVKQAWGERVTTVRARPVDRWLVVLRPGAETAEFANCANETGRGDLCYGDIPRAEPAAAEETPAP